MALLPAKHPPQRIPIAATAVCSDSGLARPRYRRRFWNAAGAVGSAKFVEAAEQLQVGDDFGMADAGEYDARLAVIDEPVELSWSS